VSLKNLCPVRQVRELLLPLVADGETSMEVGGAAALALGLVFISSQDEDAVGAALQVGDEGAQHARISPMVNGLCMRQRRQIQ